MIRKYVNSTNYKPENIFNHFKNGLLIVYLCWEVILHKSMASSTSCFFFLEWKNNSQYPNPNYPNAEIAKIGATLQDISRIVQLVQPIAELSYTDVFPYMVLRLVFNED